MARKLKKLVALVGRPNVGKSTLFNRLVGSKKAIVHDTPGLTRDRNYSDVTIDGKSFVIVDTGGFEPSTDDEVLAQMRTQTMIAVEQADIIVFLGDGQAGLTPSDNEIVRILQRADKKVFYVVNKIDSDSHIIQTDSQGNIFAYGVTASLANAKNISMIACDNPSVTMYLHVSQSGQFNWDTTPN